MHRALSTAIELIMSFWCALCLTAPLLASGSALLHIPRKQPDVRRLQPDLTRASVTLALTPDLARIDKLEELLEEIEADLDDPVEFVTLIDELTALKKEGLTPGSSEWVAVVVDGEQRAETFMFASRQHASRRGQTFIREREKAERKAAEGLTPGSFEFATAVEKAAAESAQAYRLEEVQKAATREAATRKRAALLGVLLAGADSSAGGGSVAPSTDAALDVLFNSGFDLEGGAGGGGGAALTPEDLQRMQGVIASTSKELRRARGKDTALLLRRAALLVALGEAALAYAPNLEPTLSQPSRPFGPVCSTHALAHRTRRKDYERVLELEPSNPEAQKYVDRATFGVAFDPYETLGVTRDADVAAVSLAFRRLAKQWHPDRWAGAAEAERAEAETRFKQLNLAQAVLSDAAKRRKYDAGGASVADLMAGWWGKLTARWGRPRKDATPRALGPGKA